MENCTYLIKLYELEEKLANVANTPTEQLILTEYQFKTEISGMFPSDVKTELESRLQGSYIVKQMAKNANDPDQQQYIIKNFLSSINAFLTNCYQGCRIKSLEFIEAKQLTMPYSQFEKDAKVIAASGDALGK